LLKNIADCTSDELHEHLEILDHEGLGWCEEPFEGDKWEFRIGRSTGGIGWQLFKDLKTFADGDVKVLRQMVRDLDFGPLDA